MKPITKGSLDIGAPLGFVPADVTARIEEAARAMESALVAAETLASHGIVESVSYERLVEFLTEAASVLSRIDTNLLEGRMRVFLSRTLAQALIEEYSLDSNCRLQVCPSANGLYTIMILSPVTEV